jgi:hypothetical protein
MTQADKLLAALRNNPDDVRFADAVKVAKSFFGKPRINGSHHVWSTHSCQLVNLQKKKDGKAKGYQVRQLLVAIDELGAEEDNEDEGQE